VRAVVGSHAVRPIFEIRTQRRPFEIAFNGATAGEITLDETAVTAPDGGEPMRLQRIEVEVEEELVDSLTPLVADLREQALLRPAELSKFEAGLLAAGLGPLPTARFGADDDRLHEFGEKGRVRCAPAAIRRVPGQGACDTAWR